MARRCDTVGSTQSSLAVPFLDLLSPQHVRANFAAADKSQLLEKLAAMLASNADERRLIGEALGNREKLGSTGIGHGVAIPHGRIPGLDRARGVFVRLARPLAFGAIDEQPVDLVAAMAATHLARPETRGSSDPAGLTGPDGQAGEGGEGEVGMVLYVGGHVRAYQGGRKVGKDPPGPGCGSRSRPPWKRGCPTRPGTQYWS